MKSNLVLRVASLLSIVLMTLHITDDIQRGLSRAGPENANAVLIFLVWLLRTVPLGERRVGHAIMFLGGLFAAAMPVLHMRGGHYPTIATSSGGFFFVWTLLAVGTTGTFSMILAVQGLWASWRRKGDEGRREAT